MNKITASPFVLPATVVRTAFVFCFAGAFALAVLFALDPLRAWMNTLVDGFYFLGMALCGVFFVSLQFVTGARWAESIRRVPEAFGGFLPVGGLLLFVTALFGSASLYPWANADVVAKSASLAAKAAYLNPKWFLIRMVLFIVPWALFATGIRKHSLAEDTDGDGRHRQKLVVLSCLFIVVFAYTFSLASVDWIMSLEPHWTSTMFGIYSFSGLFAAGIAAIALTAVLLNERGFMPWLNENHWHDLGKLMFAFSMFWAYIWFCQFMLIWYGNIPEETAYYFHRLRGDWDWLFYFNFAVNFVIPFFVLLPRASKRSPAVVKRVAILLLIGRWIDIYLLAAPGVKGLTPGIGVAEVVIALGYAGVFVVVVGKALARGSLLPTRSPHLAESLHYHQ